MLSLSFVKAFRWFLSDCIKLRHCDKPGACIMQRNARVLITVLCLVVLKACVPLFVFNYTVAVLRGSLLLFCIW